MMANNSEKRSERRCVNPTEAEEREHLRGVVEKIDAELDAFGSRLSARHADSRDMIVAIQEHKRDMDHAEKANMRQAVNTMTRINEHGMEQQQRLSRLVESPYFGRIDLAADAQAHDHPVYIGLHSFYDAESDVQLVHDWRAPISSMFYDFELGAAHFQAPAGRREHEIVRKRQYKIENRSLSFMLETSLGIQDDILREELSRASDETMKNIVATIQREQNAIIRNDASHSLIIQGAAGSGKTSIALHRIAFLLYRFRNEIRSNEILIVSPNKVFAHYISQVLPELGEEMIQETTMETISAQLLGAGYKSETFAEQVARLLAGDDDGYADRVRFKASPSFLADLDEYIAHVRSANAVPADVEIPPYTLGAEWVAERFRICAAMPIGEQITRIVGDIVEHMQVSYQKPITSRERADIRKQVKAMFRVTSLKPLYKGFYEWMNKPEMFRKAPRGRFEYADIFPLVYLNRLVERVPPMSRIKHLVIDEMQDYTPIQYKVIDALFPCKKTILGDYNQSVSPLSASSAEAIGQVLRQAECMYMHKSYRSTIEITRVAQSIQDNPNLHPIERHGETPTLVACRDEQDEVRAVRDAIRDFRESQHHTLGIVCKTDEQAARLYDALEDDRHDVHLLDARSTVFSGGVMIATAFLAKGLEFDRVLVPSCTDDNYSTLIDKHMLYVACTRAMHLLTLTHTGRPSRLLDSAREGSLLEHARADAE